MPKKATTSGKNPDYPYPNSFRGGRRRQPKHELTIDAIYFIYTFVKSFIVFYFLFSSAIFRDADNHFSGEDRATASIAQNVLYIQKFLENYICEL